MKNVTDYHGNLLNYPEVKYIHRQPKYVLENSRCHSTHHRTTVYETLCSKLNLIEKPQAMFSCVD
jgi:hypothetical protein